MPANRFARLMNLSIRHKLRLAILGTSAAAVLLAAIATAALQWASLRESLQHDLETLAAVMAANSTAAISFGDARAARENLRSLAARPDVKLACLEAGIGDEARILARYSLPGTAGADCESRAESVPQPGEILAKVPVALGGETLGRLLLVQSDTALWSTMRGNVVALSAILLGTLLVAYMLAGILQRLILRPILALSDTAVHIARSSDFSIRARQNSTDEVGTLVGAFNFMLQETETAQARQRKLNAELAATVHEQERTNQTLQSTLDQLRETQSQLIQTEKLASLGGLVAGVAHEINTPVGVGVTAASTLRSRAEEVQVAFQKDELTVTGLRRFLEVVDQSTTILMSNLERAASLIQSFKQVAVDQTSAERRRFRVREYVDEVLLSLRPKFKHSPHTAHLDCDPAFEIDSLPGVFSQVLTNLVTNALLHAFGDDRPGRIDIAIRPSEHGMRLCFRDDGCGIPPEALPKIFDPFFTTRRGAGGSGLGLHIVYNLVTQQLGGAVSVTSQPGKGTEFTIDIRSSEHVAEHPLARSA